MNSSRIVHQFNFREMPFERCRKQSFLLAQWVMWINAFSHLLKKATTKAATNYIFIPNSRQIHTSDEDEVSNLIFQTQGFAGEPIISSK